jgi:hypothetical protein
VHSSKEERDRNRRRRERRVIARAEPLGPFGDAKAEALRRFLDDLGPRRRGAGAVDEQTIVAHAPDHVGVDHRVEGDAVRLRRVIDEVVGADEPDLLGAESDENHRAKWLFLEVHESTRDLHHHRRARRVVIGARVNRAHTRSARSGRAAVSEVIVVRTDDDRLELSCIGAMQNADDVEGVDGDGLDACRDRDRRLRDRRWFVRRVLDVGALR